MRGQQGSTTVPSLLTAPLAPAPPSAAFDPFARTDYFGVTLDLGQFERFRRILYTPYYTTLLNLSEWEVTSTLEVSESQWVARVHVINGYRREERDYSFFMEQRFGGKYDG